MVTGERMASYGFSDPPGGFTVDGPTSQTGAFLSPS